MGLIPDGPVTPEERDAMNESYTAIGRFVGHQIAEAYRENPVDFIIFLATMGRAPKGMRFSPEGFRGRIPTSIPERIASTQTTVGGQFRTGEFTNVPLSQVVTGLRNGTIKPNQVPVSIIKRDGQWYTLNNRSLKALKQAGMQPSKVIDATGDPRAEKLLTRRLNEFKDKMGELPTSEFDPPARKIPATAGEEAK